MKKKRIQSGRIVVSFISEDIEQPEVVKVLNDTLLDFFDGKNCEFSLFTNDLSALNINLETKEE